MRTKTYNPFPPSPMEIFRIVDAIHDKVMHSNNLIGIGIRQAFYEKIPYKQIIATILSQEKDNPKIMQEVLGEELLNRIKNFKK